MTSRREERLQMRQRGAATRKIKDVNFGFSFGTELPDTSRGGPTRQSPRLAEKASANPFAPLATPTPSPSHESRERVRSSPRNDLLEQPSTFDIPTQDLPEFGRSNKRRRIGSIRGRSSATSTKLTTHESENLLDEHPPDDLATSNRSGRNDNEGTGQVIHKVNGHHLNETSAETMFNDVPGPAGQPSTIPANNEVTVEVATEEPLTMQDQAQLVANTRSKQKGHVTFNTTHAIEQGGENSNAQPHKGRATIGTETSREPSPKESTEPQITSKHGRNKGKRRKSASPRSEQAAQGESRTGLRIDHQTSGSTLRARGIGNDKQSEHENAVPGSSGTERATTNQVLSSRAEISPSRSTGPSGRDSRRRENVEETVVNPPARDRNRKPDGRSSQRSQVARVESAPNEPARSKTDGGTVSQKRRRGRPSGSANLVQQQPTTTSKRTAEDEDPKDQAPKRQKRRGETVPITVHRLANVAALEAQDGSASSGEESGSSDELSTRKTLPNRGGVNYADVLSQICRETLEKTLTTLKNGIESESNASRRAEWTRKRKAVEAYGAELEGRLFDMSEVLDTNFILSVKVKKAKKAMMEIRNKVLEIRRRRQEVAIQMDTVRRQHQEEETTKMSRNAINNSLHDLELALDRNHFQKSGVEHDDHDQAEASDSQSRSKLAGMEFFMRTVAENVSSIASGSQGGLLNQIKAFNRRLEETAKKLEGQPSAR